MAKVVTPMLSSEVPQIPGGCCPPLMLEAGLTGAQLTCDSLSLQHFLSSVSGLWVSFTIRGSQDESECQLC